MKLFADLKKTQADIELTRASVDKMIKENKAFPWLQIFTTIVGGLLTGGVMLFIITKIATMNI